VRLNALVASAFTVLVVPVVVAGALSLPIQAHAARGGASQVVEPGEVWRGWTSKHRFARDEVVRVRLRAGQSLWRLRARVPFRFETSTQVAGRIAQCPPGYVGECDDTPEPPMENGLSVAVWTAQRAGVIRLRLRVANYTTDPVPVRLRWRD
jgi:hypothetical protein